MKTTLINPDPVFRDLKRRALEREETLSALASEYLSFHQFKFLRVVNPL